MLIFANKIGGETSFSCIITLVLKKWFAKFYFSFNFAVEFILNDLLFQIQCLTHTHHLGIDTQLFVLSPVLILILWKWPKMGSISLLLLATFSTGARFYVTVAHQLSNYVYFGAS